jgi:Domain of unknown function (DUF4440)
VGNCGAAVPAGIATKRRGRGCDTSRIVEPPPPRDSAGERLARRWFELVREGSLERLCEMLHEDALLVSRLDPGLVVEGREQVAGFILDKVAKRLYEAIAEEVTPLDEERVVVEGRMRWIDDDRVIRDDPVLWAMEFRDGLLLRFLPARTAVEAETLLATSPDLRQ